MTDSRRPSSGATKGVERKGPERRGPERDDLETIEHDLDELRISYEKYFAGVERLEPLKPRKEIKDAIRRAQGVANINTARKFRIQGLQARIVTLEQYWNRITRQIEDGTFKRDRLRAQKILEAPKSNGAATTSATAVASNKAATTGAAPTSAGAAKPAADSRLDNLYRDLTAARAQTGDQRPLTLAQLAATVDKQTAAVRAQFNCKDVEFKVAVKDGKAILKAVPKL